MEKSKAQETENPKERRGGKTSKRKRNPRRTASPGAQSPDLGRKVDFRKEVWGGKGVGLVNYLLEGMG